MATLVALSHQTTEVVTTNPNSFFADFVKALK
jgi:hypothetical protein